MRIPVYKSQARATSEAPGARMTARMDAQPFVNAAIQKGQVVTTAVNAVGDYASMRYKMLVEAQKNESIFAAKEALMGLSRDLERSADIGNIFDGEQKYEKGVEAVFNELRGKVGKNKYALSDFENSFRQMEIPIKFRLKDVVDSKIIARRQAALKALEDQQVEKLSDPYNGFTADDVALSQSGVQAAHDQAVKNGGINPAALGNVSDRVLSRAFKNVIPAYAGTDLNTAIQLAGVLDEINKVRAEGGDPSEMKIGGDIPQHVLNMIEAVSPEDAAAVIQGTIKMATTFYNAQEKIENAVDADTQQLNERAYNAISAIDDGQLIPADVIKSLIPQGVFEGMKKYEQYNELAGFYGYEAKEILSQSLKNQFWADPSQNKIIEKELRGDGVVFAPEGQSDDSVYAGLYGLATSGRLTVMELDSQRVNITRTEYTNFLERIYSKADQNVNSASTILARAFNYSAQQAADKDDRLSKASKSAFQKADGALREEYFRKASMGEPMTAPDLFAFAQKQQNEFMEIYRAELKLEYLDDIEFFETKMSALDLVIDPKDPIGSIDSWYGSLTDPLDQERNKENVSLFKSMIKGKYGKEDLF